MSDLIDRQAMINELDLHFGILYDSPTLLESLKLLVWSLPSAQPEYERVSAEDVAVSIAPTKLASAVWLYGTLTELEKAGYVICRKMT